MFVDNEVLKILFGGVKYVSRSGFYEISFHTNHSRHHPFKFMFRIFCFKLSLNILENKMMEICISIFLEINSCLTTNLLLYCNGFWIN